MSYVINKSLGPPFIECLECHFKSFNIHDIEKKYCANCKKFHEDQTASYDGGRYDKEAEDILKKYINEVDGVLLVVLGKPGTSGFSVACKDLALVQIIPPVLREIATNIQQQTKESPFGASKSGVKITTYDDKKD